MPSKLAQSIRAARRAVGLTQDQLGRRIGLKGRAVYRWERHEATPSKRNQSAMLTAIRSVNPEVATWLTTAMASAEQKPGASPAPAAPAPAPKAIRSSGGFASAFHVIEIILGRTRVDEIGHEHFGFKDGVSQPGIRGIDSPDDPLANPNQGHPGQDLLWPGEFVLGYPTQIPTADPNAEGPNPNAGTASTAGNDAWTKNGSFLVFRRLAQDVPAFHAQLGTFAQAHGLSVELAGAKIVGRYRSGCPLAALSMQAHGSQPSPTDPGRANPALAESDALNNAFEFGNDAKGERVPRAAHIRKAYPRDEETPPLSADDSESHTQTRRLLRRGIPFGASFGAAKGGSAGDPRGLLFLAYQSDIEKHFEFVQRAWVNSPTFPTAPPGLQQPGEDPVIAESPSGPFQIDANAAPVPLSHFVTTTGGEYLFAPSISTLLSF